MRLRFWPIRLDSSGLMGTVGLSRGCYSSVDEQNIGHILCSELDNLIEHTFGQTLVGDQLALAVQVRYRPMTSKTSDTICFCGNQQVHVFDHVGWCGLVESIGSERLPP